MGAISATPERGISVSFSQPYLLIKKVLIVNRLLDLKLDSKQIDTLKFGVPKDSSYENALHEKFFSLNRYPNSSQLISYDNMDLAFKDVLAGKIYAFYTDEAYANSFFEKNKKAHLYVKKDILQRQFDPITIAVSWKNQTLLNWINLYIQSIRIDGTEDMLMKKYLKGL
jgi:ABC-type amino acid transport substrate-binding protein